MKVWKKLTKYLFHTDQQMELHKKGVASLFVVVVILLIIPFTFKYFSRTSQNIDVGGRDSLLVAYALYKDSLVCLEEDKKQKWLPKEREQSYQRSSQAYTNSNTTSNNYNVYSPKEKTIVKFNLNNATKEQLKEVRGIGDFYADRIIKFRDKLGGFYSKNQLYEVYGLDSSVVSETFKHLDDSKLLTSKNIAINTDSFKGVLAHPYLKYEEVQAIFNNRPLTDSSLCVVLPDKCDKLKWYVTYD